MPKQPKRLVMAALLAKLSALTLVGAAAATTSRAQPPEAAAKRSPPPPEAARAQGDAPEALPPEHQPTLSLTLAPQSGSVALGDAVQATLIAVVPPGDDVSVPEQAFPGFELLERSHQVEVDADEHQRFTFSIQLLALTSGPQRVGPIQVRVVTEDGEVGRAQSPSASVEVASRLANEPHPELKAPTPPVVVFEDDYTLAWVLGTVVGALVIAGLGFLVAVAWMRRPKRAAPPRPPRPAHEVAEERLAALLAERRRGLSPEQAASFVDRLSDVLREYLGRRFGFQGLESTTDELMIHLGQVELPGVLHAEVERFLRECDLVKFAEVVPSDSECDQLYAVAERVVERSRRSSDAPARSRPPGAPDAGAKRSDDTPGDGASAVKEESEEEPAEERP